MLSETTEIVKLIVLQTWLLLQLRSGQEMKKYIGTTALSQLVFFTCLLLVSMLTAEFVFQYCLHSQN